MIRLFLKLSPLFALAIGLFYLLGYFESSENVIQGVKSDTGAYAVWSFPGSKILVIEEIDEELDGITVDATYEVYCGEGAEGTGSGGFLKGYNKQYYLDNFQIKTIVLNPDNTMDYTNGSGDMFRLAQCEIKD